MLSRKSPVDPFHSPYRHQVPERFEKAVKILYAGGCRSVPGALPAAGNSRQRCVGKVAQCRRWHSQWFGGNQMKRTLLGAMAVFFIAASPLQGQVYQWVDEDGVKHFSNTPPPDGVNDVRTFKEVKSESGADSSGASEPQGAVEAEGGDKAQTQAPAPAQNPAAAAASGESEEQEIAVAEDAGGVEGFGEALEGDESEETAAPDTPDAEDLSDLQEGDGPESAAAGRRGADELIGQEQDRLEVRTAQLNRQLEEAQAARDSSSDDDAERWNKRIQQLRAQIEKEKKRSEARIEEIRSQSGL